VSHSTDSITLASLKFTDSIAYVPHVHLPHKKRMNRMSLIKPFCFTSARSLFLLLSNKFHHHPPALIVYSVRIQQCKSLKQYRPFSQELRHIQNLE